MNARNCQVAPPFIVILIVFIVLLQGTPLFAQMEEVSDEDLSFVCAQVGITYNWGDSKLLVTSDSIRFSDTDHDPHNWIELNDFSISGPGGYFTLDERSPDPDIPFYTFNTVDVDTITTIDGKERTLVQFVDSTNTNPRTWEIGNLVFCSQGLGSIQFDAMNVDSAVLNLTTHGAGESGIEFEYLANWATENFSYSYNASGGALSASGIHLAEKAIGASDNPADPSTWEFSGRFRVGDLYGGTIDVDNDPSNAALSNPATFDVATDTSSDPSKTCAYANLPMKGTIRVGDVKFGGTSFGPVAIDGITVHHLGIKIDPGI